MAAYIAAQKAGLRPILASIRALVRKAAPSRREKVKMDVPWHTGHDGVLYIAAYLKH